MSNSEMEMKIEALTRCVDPGVFAKAMQEVSAGPVTAPQKNTKRSDIDVNREIRKLLTELGMPAHLKGYRCTITAIKLLIEKPDTLDSITKDLYPMVAQEHDTSASRVERAIRHGVECVWDRADYETLLSHFGNTISRYKGKPTNGEFLSKCAEIVQLRQETKNN